MTKAPEIGSVGVNDAVLASRCLASRAAPMEQC